MLDAADLRYGGGRGELRQARHHQALFYMGSIAEQLDLEMPGALPEISPSPEYDPFVDFRERAIHHFLGISPDVPAGSLSVVPDVPDSWLGLSVENLRVGSGTAAASASRRGKRYHHRGLRTGRLPLQRDRGNCWL